MVEVIDERVRAPSRARLTAGIAPSHAVWRATIVSEYLEDLRVALGSIEVTTLHHKAITSLGSPLAC